ncbi:hypothetical protein GQ600_24282 [Phytophthora cactorum]|nr:hypothetical protein GQ600_24282 [Phytophthora cactorum]
MKRWLHYDTKTESSSSSGASPSSPVTAVDGALPPRRAGQIVNTVKQRAKAVRWMVLTEKSAGIKGLCAEVVDEFLEIFRSATRVANISKAARWWKKRETIFHLSRGVPELSAMRERGRSRVNRKEIIKKYPDGFAGKTPVAASVDSDADASGNSVAEGMGTESPVWLIRKQFTFSFTHYR